MHNAEGLAAFKGTAQDPASGMRDALRFVYAREASDLADDVLRNCSSSEEPNSESLGRMVKRGVKLMSQSKFTEASLVFDSDVEKSPTSSALLAICDAMI